jgi:hypothetical protein
MKGSIRFFTGMLVTLGCVGGMETNPDVSVTTYLLISIVSLYIMYSGAKALGKNYA